jgi:hypothetical protein
MNEYFLVSIENPYLLATVGVVILFVFIVFLCRGKGFWSDTDGLTLSEFVGVILTPIWAITALKMAFSAEVTAVQVDFFLALTYPVLMILGGKAVEKITLPSRGGLAAGSTTIVNNALANEKTEGAISGQSNRY